MTQLAVIDRGTGLGEVAASFRTQPHNIEAEQAVLGAILVNNEAYPPGRPSSCARSTSSSRSTAGSSSTCAQRIERASWPTR